MTTTSIAAADAELLRLETAVSAIAVNLVDLEGNPARRDLDKTRLTGATAIAWADATEALAQLWDGYRTLTDSIAQARSLREQRRFSDTDRATFAHLVLGRSITLSTTTVPLAQRGLLGAGQVSTTCSLGELLSAMEAAFGTAVTVVTRAGEVWQRLLPAAADAATAVDTLRTLTRQAGGSTATVDEADRRLGVFTATLAADPLSTDEHDLAAVRTLLQRADAERTSAAELRELLTRRLGEAKSLLSQLTEAAKAATTAADALRGRFADADIVAVSVLNLRPDLTAIELLAAAGHWSLIIGRLADWTRRANAQLAALREAAARNTGLLAARNELRGRLDAFKAKALGRGLSENEELSTLATAAHELLHRPPCDLDAARRAVDAYQTALTATIARIGS